MKHFRYMRYLARHKFFVLLAGIELGVPFWRLIIHDWSKLSPIEWFPYAEFFYGKNSRKTEDAQQPRHYKVPDDVRAAFDRAWLHHQHLNPHHWQHWILRQDDGSIKVLPIPNHFLREMVADWAGAGRAITGKWDLRPWYWRNSKQIELEDETRRMVVYLIEKFCEGEHER